MFGLLKAAKEINKAALIYYAATAVSIEIAGMNAENDNRKAKNESMAYTENDYLESLNHLQKTLSTINKK